MKLDLAEYYRVHALMIVARKLAAGEDSEQEDELLDQLDRVWSALGDPDREHIRATRPGVRVERNIAETLGMDKDLIGLKGVPPRMLAEAA